MLVVLFSLTTLVSAFLLFWVQPLIAKLLLPLLGGTPAVWNTAMMFFQIVLLGGYLYVHLLRGLALRWQIPVHLGLLLLALVFLPFGSAAGLVAPTGRTQVLWLVATLAALVGVPFFAISASAPLLQSWFGQIGHPRARDPYFLYAASNLGSFAALLGFPLILEPALRLHTQGQVWAGMFVVLLALLAVCAVLVGRSAGPRVVTQAAEGAGWGERLVWIVLSFIPSSLLLGVTSFVGTDLASVPLLWVIPLALYLLTFVIVFGRAMSDRAAGAWLAGGLIAVMVLLTAGRLLGVQIPAWVSVPGHFGGFVAIALGCHGALAGRRPAAGRLTEFYLCMSIGGATGGVLNALVAPLVLNSTYEYELGLAAAAFVLLLVRRRSPGGVVLDLMMAGLLTAGFLLASIKLKTLADWAPWAGLAVAVSGAALFATFARRPLRLALAVTLALGAGLFARNVIGVVHEERSFFGVHRIRALDDGGYRALIHGDIIHGVQSTDPARQRETSTYYVAEGPVGQVFKALGPVRRVGVIGLGTGGMACFARPGEAWIFFEIDAAVARLARDTRYFSYLAACGDPPVVLGDGRITVAAEGGFDVLVLDAFSSDAIPVHLLTREAFALYLSKLNPGGRLLVHISNKYKRLAPVVAAGAAENGAVAVTQFHRPDAAAVARWATASEWVVVARTAGDLAFTTEDKRWSALVPQAGFAAWTDEASNILGVLKW